MNNNSVCDVLAAVSLAVIALSSVVASIALTVAAFYPIFTGAIMASLHTGG